MRILYLLLSVCSALAIFSSCLSFDDATQATSLTVMVQQPEGFAASTAKNGRTVVLITNGDTLRATTDTAGRAIFPTLIPGLYSISTSWTLTADEFRQSTSQEVNDNDFIVSGNLAAQVVDAATPTLTLRTNVAQVPSLVVSKVYASGSRDGNNRNYAAGKYIEFFNNSDRSLRLSDFGFGLLESGSTPAYALGQTPEYLYLKQAYRFPENGQMLAPGQSVVVANSAINHLNNNAPQEYDLSAADYEAKDASGRTVNNPKTPTVTLIFTSWPQVTLMNLVQGGPTSVVIFHTKDAATWTQVYANGKSSGQQYLRMPVRAALDGIDIIKYSPTNGADLSSKRLYPMLDAGYTHISSASGWNGEVTYRRAAPATDGQTRTLLLDTNNSANDCNTAKSLAPGQFIP